METKTCVCCNTEKPVSDFHRNKNEADGYQRRCKQCNAESYKSSRNKKREHYNRVQADRVKRNTEAARAWKSERGCLCCGETFGPCLELHHPDPSTKDFNPSDLAGRSMKRFLQEAEKCVVVCANCHRKVHHGVIDLKDFGV